jgi:hypothetical protein
MPRDIHVFGWEDEPADERPSEFVRSTGYGGLYSTQHGGLYSTQHGGFFATQQDVTANTMADMGFTRPSPLPRDRVRPRRRLRELPVSLVLGTILGGAAWLLYEFARIAQR